MKGLLSIACLVLSLAALSQKDTLRFYYAIDASDAAPHRKRIDSMSNALKRKAYNVWIYGYADFLHHDRYNEALSKRRAESIRRLLLKRSSEPQMTIMACEGRGERASSDNGNQDGDPLQRRVDLIVEVRPPNRVPDTRPSKLRKRDTLHGDPVQINVEQLKREGKAVLRGLTFVPGRHQLMTKSVPVLEGLLTTMLQNPELRIMIEGHICCWQGDGDGLDHDTGENKLSYNRAKAVYDYLVENGVEPDRMEFEGLGHSQPLVPEVSPETEQMNRRVEIRILK